MALVSVDTLYTTYDTYTSADALDYAQSPSTLVEKGIDSDTYFTKVKSITVGDYYSYTRNINTISRTIATLAAAATTTVNLAVVAGNPFPASGYALIGAEIIYYATTTEVAGSTTNLNTLMRGQSGTIDVDHGISTNVFPLALGTVASIDHNKDEDVFNINTLCTIVDAQYGNIVENNMFTIPSSEVAMVKYAA